MKKVAILAGKYTSLFELGCATELFAMPRPEFKQWYQAEVVSFDSEKLQSDGGVGLQVKYIADLSDYQMLVIPSWPTDKPQLSKTVVEQVRQFYSGGGRILSFCSGAFFIAETGLLDARQATTHWRYADTFKQRYRQTEFVENVLYVYQDRLGCSAGSASALDLGLEVIRQDFGHEAANAVARRLVISPHRSGGQAQFVETPVVQNHCRFSSTLDWAIENLHQPLSIAQLAEQAAMSRRSFDRHFRAALGSTPKEWLIRQRINLAQKLLESSDDDIEVIAFKSGFNNAMNLRHHFRQVLSISPSQYRAQFADKGVL